MGLEQCLRNQFCGSKRSSSDGTRVPSEPGKLVQGPALAANSLRRRAEKAYTARAGRPKSEIPANKRDEHENTAMPAEFDGYAAEGYSKLLSDPLRERFAGSEFFFQRKLILLRELCQRCGMNTERASWLDVGCGEGSLLKMGKPYFREVAGCDVSAGMLRHCEGLNVRRQDSAQRIPFDSGSFDLVTVVCVYHHVDVAERPALTADISRVLKAKGILCVIEHNPLNPVAQLIVRRSSVDSHAHLLTAGKVRRLARAVQMEVLGTHYFLFFPERYYSAMAATEARLSSLPLGGQYAVFCRKD